MHARATGSVHGDSIGVHACDSANAWRSMVRPCNRRNAVASLIPEAYQVRQPAALARVTASECGRPAGGYAQSRELLKM